MSCCQVPVHAPTGFRVELHVQELAEQRSLTPFGDHAREQREGPRAFFGAGAETDPVGDHLVPPAMTSKAPASREPRTDIPARRVSAFIYGNILVLAALILLSPDGLETTRGFVFVLGVAFSTFIAHVASDIFAHLLRHPNGEGLSALLPHELKDSVPIAASAILPTVILVAARLGWLEAEPAWGIAVGVTLAQLSLLGPIAAWLAREPLSPWPLFAGILLALLIAVIALLKVVLTH